MELSLFNNKTTVNAHTQLLAVQQQQIHQAATAIDIYRHNKGNIGDFKFDFSLEKWCFWSLMENTFSVKEKSNLVAPGSDYDISTPPSLFFNLTPAEPQTENGNREAKPISIKLTLPV